MAVVLHYSMKWSEWWVSGCSSPRCHDTVTEDVASCAAPLPSPTVLPLAEPPELLGISSFLLFLHLVYLVLPLLPLVFIFSVL